MKHIVVGVLAFHGDVIEHLEAMKEAAREKKTTHVIPVRTNEELMQCTALIIPGGESTTLHTLSKREGMWEQMKKIPAILGTCAGAIMLARRIQHSAQGQETLERMDITVDRNAYGRQTESFEKTIPTALGSIGAIFIRAPKIVSVGKRVRILARDGSNILACEQEKHNQYSLALAFHPELTTAKFHAYFLGHVLRLADHIA